MNYCIDLNCDAGEGWDDSDAELLRHVSSVNVACGFHAGDAATMRRTVELALRHGVAIGAHPGLPDRAGFGRRWIETPPAAVRDLVLYQIGALSALTVAAGGKLRHVKPHGALYNRAAVDPSIAAAIARGVHDFDPRLVLLGLAGGELVRAGQSIGLPTAQEAFADRTYQADGALTPREQPGAVISDVSQAAEQVLRLVRTGTVLSQQGTELAIQADTICLHGDRPEAATFAGALREQLTQAGVAVRALGGQETESRRMSGG